MSTGSSGYIDAWPNPCPVIAEADSSTTTLSWSSYGTAAAFVTVQDLEGGETRLSSALCDSAAITLEAGGQYTVRLYSADGNEAALLDSLIVTTEHVLEPIAPAGWLSALPCLVGSSRDVGTTLVSWGTRGVTKAEVMVEVDAQGQQVFAPGLAGQKPFTALEALRQYVFRLYDLSAGGRVLLSEAGVTAQTGARIEAVPNPCFVSSPRGYGQTGLAWATPGDQATEVTLQERGGEEVVYSTVPRGHLPFSQVRLGSWYIFRLYSTSSGQRQLVDSVVVTAVEVDEGAVRSGTITASPTVAAVEDGERGGETFISWTTHNIPSVEVTMQQGEVETVLATRPSGEQTVSDLNADKPYVFRVYDLSDGSRRLLDGVVVAAV